MKIKVKIGDETHEVESSDLDLGNLQLVDPENPPKGLFNQSGLDQQITDRLNRATSTAHNDESIQKKVLSHFGISLDKDGKPVGVKQADEEAQFKAWYEKHAKPLEDQIAEKDGTITKFKSNLVGESVKTLAAKYLDKKAANNPFFIKGIQDNLGFDQESESIVVMDGDKPMRNGAGKLVSADEWFQHETKSGSLKDVAIDNRPSSSGFQNGSGTGSTVQISASDAKNHQKYSEAQAKAQESGATLEITE